MSLREAFARGSAELKLDEVSRRGIELRHVRSVFSSSSGDDTRCRAIRNLGQRGSASAKKVVSDNSRAWNWLV